MSEQETNSRSTLALSTKVEEDFIAPLTAMRGALEILRDYADLSQQERQRFVTTALKSCQQIERAVHELADIVYEAGQMESAPPSPESGPAPAGGHAERIRLDTSRNLVELDFSDLTFANSAIVNEVYDAIEATIRPTRKKWYFIVNFANCTIWPEAWVAFAHRGKRLSTNFAHAVLRYAPSGDEEEDGRSRNGNESDIFSSREAALAEIERMREGG